MKRTHALLQQDALPIPNPQDWLGVPAAARLLHCSRPHVYYLVKHGRLTGYTLDGASVTMLWAAEVHELAAARLRVRGAGPA